MVVIDLAHYNMVTKISKDIVSFSEIPYIYVEIGRENFKIKVYLISNVLFNAFGDIS